MTDSTAPAQRPPAAEKSRSTRSWEENLALLVQYKHTFGDCRVPDEFPSDPSLSHWLKHQRRLFQNGTLSVEKRQQLEEVGFNFSSQKKSWKIWFDLLKAWKALYGNCRVPQKATFQGHNLGTWFYYQRCKHKKGTLDEQHRKQLDSIGFVWSRKTTKITGKRTSSVAGSENTSTLASKANDGGASKRAKPAPSSENQENHTSGNHSRKKTVIPQVGKSTPPPRKQLFSWLDNSIPILRLDGIVYRRHPLDTIEI